MILYCGCTKGGPQVHEIGKDGKATGARTMPVTAPHAAQYQNARYGAGMRVHVPADKVLTCTVCGKERQRQ